MYYYSFWFSIVFRSALFRNAFKFLVCFYRYIWLLQRWLYHHLLLWSALDSLLNILELGDGGNIWVHGGSEWKLWLINPLYFGINRSTFAHIIGHPLIMASFLLWFWNVISWSTDMFPCFIYLPKRQRQRLWSKAPFGSEKFSGFGETDGWRVDGKHMSPQDDTLHCSFKIYSPLFVLYCFHFLSA